MKYSLCFDPEVPCVVLTCEGAVDLQAIRELAPHVAHTCSETGCPRILIDMGAATLELSVMQIFESPSIMDQSHIPRTPKRAGVMPSGFTDAHFLETITRNRGHNFKLFSTVAEAKAWLHQDP